MPHTEPIVGGRSHAARRVAVTLIRPRMSYAFVLRERPEVLPEHWNAFVDASDEAWLWHRSELQAALATWPERTDVSFAVLAPSGELHAVVPLHVVTTRRLGPVRLTRLDSHGGPALRNGVGGRERRHIWETIEGRIDEIARRFDAVEVEVILPPLAPANRPGRGSPVNPLLTHGYANVLTQTWLIPLDRPEEEIRAGYSQTARQEIRKANQTSTVREASGPADLDLYYALHVETYRRTGVRPHPFEYFEAIFRDFQAVGRSRILFAERDGEVVAAQNTAIDKQAALYWTGASARERAGGENRLLCDRQIMTARSNGCQWYEMGEAFPGTADTKLAGLSHFKRGFGGNLHPLYRGRRVRRQLVAAGLELGRVLRSAAAGRRGRRE
jgi:hypothetical protein